MWEELRPTEAEPYKKQGSSLATRYCRSHLLPLPINFKPQVSLNLVLWGPKCPVVQDLNIAFSCKSSELVTLCIVTPVRVPHFNRNSKDSALHLTQACGEKSCGLSSVHQWRCSFCASHATDSRHRRVVFARWETGFAVKGKTVVVAFWHHST